MLKLKKIAITGGLAAGKTTVCQLFKELGAYVVSADEIVHQILSPETAIGQQVIYLLGTDIVSGQVLDRKKIATKVFAKPDLLRALESVIHPAVFDAIEQKYQEANKEKKFPLFIAEIPLLYETDAEKYFQVVISVVADREHCRERFIHMHKSSEEFEKRMKRQWEPQLKAHKAHLTIENNGDFAELKTKVKTTYIYLTK